MKNQQTVSIEKNSGLNSERGFFNFSPVPAMGKNKETDLLVKGYFNFQPVPEMKEKLEMRDLSKNYRFYSPFSKETLKLEKTKNSPKRRDEQKICVSQC
ncbi:MAG: hypothetical protein ACRCU3_09840 [Eubacteriaceae bacterium]